MDAEQWAILRSHVEAAASLPLNQRSEYLQLRIADPAMRQEVRELLGYEEEATEILSIGKWQDRAFAAAVETSLEGLLLGNYRMLGEIGRGGMGAVYLAERADGVYEHKVAIKVLQETISSPGLDERFREERQILARLSHPGIARLLDGGVTPDGRPYLVLEYIDGVTIDRFCIDHGLATEAILRLFICVAEVVQSAHQQLVLHLDLKPANILVTPNGEPRLLDFGIARVLGSGADEAAKAEQTIRLLTPRYASPEQLRGETLGVASDVFSLGTLLYRLLTGVLPYPLEDVSALEAARMVMSTPPIAPSKVAPESRRQALEGDLDTILFEALRKEPERRYATVAAFAEDLRAHLEARPVRAHADSLRYRAGKFVRRNRLAVAGTLAAALLLTAATAVAIRFAVKAQHSRLLAERRLAETQAIAHSYVFDLDTMLSEIPGTLHVRQFALTNAQRYLDERYAEAQDDEKLADDVVEGYIEIARVQAVPGQPSIGDVAGAERSYRRAVEIEQHIFALHPDDLAHRRAVVRAMLQYANYFTYIGDPVREDQLLLQAWEVAQPLLQGPDRTKRYLITAQVAYELALLRCGNGDDWNFADPLAAATWLDRAQELIERYQREVPKEKQVDLARALAERVFISRGTVLIRTNRAPEAIAAFRNGLALTSLESKGQLEDVARKELQNFLTDLLLLQGDVTGARANAQEPRGKDVHEKVFDHQLTRDDADDLVLRGRLELAEGKVVEGRQKIVEGLAALEAVNASLPQDVEMSSGLAWEVYQLGEENGLEPAQRERYYRRGFALAEAYVPTHPGVLSAVMLMGKCNLGLARLADNKHREERVTLAAKAAVEFSEVLGAHHPQPEAQLLLDQSRSLISR